jgi:hypothetical protein
VVVIDGADRIQMKYSLADNRISSNVFGAKGRSTLNGNKADLRIKSDSPQFMLYSDPAVNLSNAVALVRLDVKSDHREIRRWSEHFDFNGARIAGVTATGRVTVDLLRLNTDARLLERETLIAVGRYPPSWIS